MSGRREIFFGTSNENKLNEIRGILGNSFILRSFKDLPAIPEVEETAPDLEGNAETKARAYYAFTGLPCFADDTGLEVDALDGRPGVYSARYAGKDANAANNRAKLLGELVDMDNRNARFRTVIAYYDGRALHLFQGILEGSIAFKATGSEGFGYDPVFIPSGQSRSLAEYSPDEKNEISHRGIAVRKFVKYLQENVW